jgi:hypothetical protein
MTEERDRLKFLYDQLEGISNGFHNKLATMTDLAEDWAIRAKEAQRKLAVCTKALQSNDSAHHYNALVEIGVIK